MDRPSPGLFNSPLFNPSRWQLELKMRFNDGPVHNVNLTPQQIAKFFLAGTPEEYKSVAKFLGDAVTSPLGTKPSEQEGKWWEKKVVMVHYSFKEDEWHDMPIQRVDVMNWGIGAVPGAFVGYALAKILGAAGIARLATHGAAAGGAVVGAKIGSWIHPFVPGARNATTRVLETIENSAKAANDLAHAARDTATPYIVRGARNVRKIWRSLEL